MHSCIRQLPHLKDSSDTWGNTLDHFLIQILMRSIRGSLAQLSTKTGSGGKQQQQQKSCELMSFRDEFLNFELCQLFPLVSSLNAKLIVSWLQLHNKDRHESGINLLIDLSNKANTCIFPKVKLFLKLKYVQDTIKVYSSNHVYL